MTRREVWGTVLIVVASLCGFAAHLIIEAYRTAAREGLLLYIGVPADTIAFRFLVAALLHGGVGLWFLIPPFIRRIPKKVPRHIAG